MKSRNLITSVKTLFPNKETFKGSGDLRYGHIFFGGDL